MLFISVDDFFAKAGASVPLSQEDEKKYAVKKSDGDINAREIIVNSYLPFVASFIRRAPEEIQRLSTVYACINCLEKGVDDFNFQGRETFAHYLSLRLRNCITKCIAER